MAIRQALILLGACLVLSSCQTDTEKIAQAAAVKAVAEVPRPILHLPKDCTAHVIAPPAPVVGELARHHEKLWRDAKHARDRKADNCAAFESQWNRGLKPK